MIISDSRLSLAPQIASLVKAMAAMGHHGESGTPEFLLVQAYAQGIANGYADDAVNRWRFMATAGFSLPKPFDERTGMPFPSAPLPTC